MSGLCKVKDEISGDRCGLPRGHGGDKHDAKGKTFPPRVLFDLLWVLYPGGA